MMFKDDRMMVQNHYVLENCDKDKAGAFDVLDFLKTGSAHQLIVYCARKKDKVTRG